MTIYTSLPLAVLLALSSVPCRGDTKAGSSADADMDTLCHRYLASVIPEDAKSAANLRAQADQEARSLRPDGTWADVNYASDQRSNWPARVHLERVLLMSKSYRMSRDAGSPENALKARIDLSLNWWLDHDLKNPNWWHNEIGIPLLAGGTALMLEPELTPRQRDKVVEILKRANWTKWTGENLVWGVTIQIQRGLITRDIDTITQAFDRMNQEVRISTAEGIQPDFSFHQHGAQLYNGGYGLNFAQDVTRFTSFSWGTRWQLPPDKLHILMSYLLDGERWMMRHGRIDYSVVGREIVRKGKTAVPRSWTGGPISPVGAGYGLYRAVELLARCPVPRAEELRDWLTSLAGRNPPQPLAGNRCFWCSEYVAHQRPGWFASVKMFSTRMINAELVNQEGKQSQHLSDGANFLYLDGDEYLNIFPVWDWCKVPGTTAEQGDADAESEPGRGIGIRGKSSFVGGVSDGTYGLAAMDLQRGALSAHKAWVFFDDCYVCLGAGISCESNRDVATSVNQFLLRGKVERGNTERAAWIHHDHVGYVFDKSENLKLSAGPQIGSWHGISPESDVPITKEVFNLWLDHGVRPREATYVYTVLPEATVERAREFAANPEIQIISNSAERQAVFHPKLNLLAASLYKPGKIVAGGWNVEVDRPCLILLRREGGRTILAISDPSRAVDTVRVTLNRHVIEARLPQGERAGSSAVINVPAESAD